MRGKAEKQSGLARKRHVLPEPSLGVVNERLLEREGPKQGNLVFVTQVTKFLGHDAAGMNPPLSI